MLWMGWAYSQSQLQLHKEHLIIWLKTKKKQDCCSLMLCSQLNVLRSVLRFTEVLIKKCVIIARKRLTIQIILIHHDPSEFHTCLSPASIEEWKSRHKTNNILLLCKRVYLFATHIEYTGVIENIWHRVWLLFVLMYLLCPQITPCIWDNYSKRLILFTFIVHYNR